MVASYVYSRRTSSSRYVYAQRQFGVSRAYSTVFTYHISFVSFCLLQLSYNWWLGQYMYTGQNSMPAYQRLSMTLGNVG